MIADVPSYTENPTGDETAHVLAFDIDTGERRWTFDLESHIESFIARGTITALNLDDEPILLAANVEGVLFRIDPATGSEIWRNDALPGQGPVIVAGVNGPLEYTVQRGPVYTDVDGATGLPRTG